MSARLGKVSDGLRKLSDGLGKVSYNLKRCQMVPFVTFYIMKWMDIDVTPSLLGFQAEAYRS